ncbi:nuclear transport factor 2 family protein [Haloarcula sediminis]|uniref:nuclear transport factor 2 family protein n=1 Tax=Haloarcula sediminis TaxID=3111777 RepID=UPI002D77E02C|nr:nuclear transport factor 2 family protein [Haloarcula sp. CK38]
MSDPPTEPVAQARAYYRTLDEGEYDRLAALLAEGFVHDRPDQTIEGRERFVRFMREERPQTDTTHPIDAVFEGVDGVQPSGTGASPDQPSAGREPPDRRTGVAVRGRLLDADGTPIASFVDVFTFAADRIARIETYTR